MPLPFAGYARITGQFVQALKDAADVGTDPDELPASGTVTLVPRPKIIRFPGLTIGKGVVPDPIVITLNAQGYVVDHAGNLYIDVVPTDDETSNPTDWTWEASFALTGQGGKELPIPSFSFSAPAGETTDLIKAMPVDSSEGVLVLQGVKGADGVTPTDANIAPILSQPLSAAAIATATATSRTGQYLNTPAGSYFTPRGNRSTAAQILDRLNTIPFYLPRAKTLVRLGCEVTAAGAAGAVMRLGIYNVDPATGLPTTLVLDAGTVDATTTGAKEITINQALAVGWYALASASQVAACSTRTLTMNAAADIASGALSTAVRAAPASGWFKASVPGAFPANHGAVSDITGEPALVAFRV